MTARRFDLRREHLRDKHYAAQLIERLTWATNDAEQLESGAAHSSTSEPDTGEPDTTVPDTTEPDTREPALVAGRASR